MSGSITIEPIGIIRTPYKERQQAPRQPGVGPQDIVGTIELFPDRNFDQALEDLAGFERIWIVSWFHLNPDWKPKVLPPRSGRTKRGVFATRSPHRPNPIGLSLCTLLGVSGRTIRVANPDLLDGTPILDIKPYIPYAEAFPDSAAGWIDELPQETERTYTVVVAPLVRTQADWLTAEFGIHLLDRAVEVLSFDPLPHSYRRIMVREEGGYVMAVKSWRIHFSVEGTTVTITELLSGYPPEALARAASSGEPLHDHDAHRQFHERWMTR